MSLHNKTVLRLLTCGSVDDGKSTLIGRILYDCDALYEEELIALSKELTEDGSPDFSVLLDGLLSEREQAITIDVAYRSFTTEKRRYLMADAPGHEQYTRNMVTGASHSDVALLLIDATKAQVGLLTQTIRHTYILSLLGIRHIIVAVNKMDLCGYSGDVFEAIEKKCQEYTQNLHFDTVNCIPVSALRGDNICTKSNAMDWYKGQTLLDVLETIEPVANEHLPFRMPVQWVARSQDFRGLSGTIISGQVSVGQKVKIMPGNTESVVKQILTYDGALQSAGAEQAVCIELEGNQDVGRGDVLADAENLPLVSDKLSARVVWLNDPPLMPGRTYLFRLGTFEAIATVVELSSQFDLSSQEELPANVLKTNDVGSIAIRLNRPIPMSTYAEQRDLGGFLLIDRISCKTLGAGMIDAVLKRTHNIVWQDFELNKTTYSIQKNQKSCVLWFTGLSASGKSTVANLVAQKLFEQGRHLYILDGDNLRHGLNRDLGFTESDRVENIRRASEVAHLMVDAGLIVLASFISPYRSDRMAIRDRFMQSEFYEIFVDTPLELCAERDPKGLYKRAFAGDIANFTGVSAPFERPETPDLLLDGRKKADILAEEVMAFYSTIISHA